MRLQLLITAKSGDHPSMGAGWLILGASLSVVGALAPATPCLGRTWHVPVDAPTIQAGIDSAAAGDHVHVAPGVYCEHDIILKGDVLVRSEEGAGVTTVDAEGLGRGFYADRLGAVAAIEGFTIRNGMTDGYGGGVGAWQTPFRISSCMVINCVAGVGGGVYASGPRLEVIDCIVSGCVSTVSGGGIALRPVEAGSIVGCEIIDNEVTYGEGGGDCGRWIHGAASHDGLQC